MVQTLFHSEPSEDFIQMLFSFNVSWHTMRHYYWQTSFFTFILLYLGFICININPVFGEDETISDKVYFMKSHSTATIKVEWILDSHPSSWTYDVTKKIYETNLQNSSSVESPDLIINSNPTSIDLHNILNTVTYTITAKNDVKGVYEFPTHFCGYSPLLVVGLNESEVNPLMFYNHFAGVYTCPAPPLTLTDQVVVNYTGIISKDVSVDLTQISPLKQFGKAHSIICKHGFVLAKKVSDNTPACLKPQTAEKLVEHGRVTLTPLQSTLKQNNSAIISNSINVMNTNFPINYTIVGGKLLTAFTNVPGEISGVTLQPTSNGILNMTVPENLFFEKIYVMGNYSGLISYSESFDHDHEKMTLSIPFNKNDYSIWLYSKSKYEALYVNPNPCVYTCATASH